MFGREDLPRCVCLHSGGLDSAVCLALLAEQGVTSVPVFLNYGQRALTAEIESFERINRQFGLGRSYVFEFPDFGAHIRTGLTDASQDIVSNAFTPNRNLLFLLLAASVGYQHGISDVVIGLLSAETAIFPDQTDTFLQTAQNALSESLGFDIVVHTPLRAMTKKRVVDLANRLGVRQTYSCHVGGPEPCGECIACKEFEWG